MATTPSFFISWMLMSIPVKSYPAARSDAAELTNLHAPCAKDGKAAKLNLFKRCSCCTTELPFRGGDEIKGYEAEKGRYMLLSKEEIDSVALTPPNDELRRMTVAAFVPFDDVDPVFFDKANYLGPVDAAAAKAYTLFRNALEATGMAALVTYYGHGRDKLGLIRPIAGGALLAHELYFGAEVRSFEEQARVQITSVTVSDQERDLVNNLISEAAEPFDIKPYQDGYLVRLRELIAAKQAGQTITLAAAPDRPAPPPTGDMTAMLTAMTASLKSKKAAAPAPAPVPGPVPEPVVAAPAKKGPTKVTPEKPAAKRRKTA